MTNAHAHVDPRADPILQSVCRALDQLLLSAKPYHGLLPSIMDRHTGVMLETLPDPIPGQRNGDRAHLGSNLMHDQVTLATFLGLGEAMGRPDYQEAAHAYLRRFATHCAATPTGLFPWGEHSFWHLTNDAIGNSYGLLTDDINSPHRRPVTHDHLRAAPLWLWEKLWALNPHCVEQFALGLDFHWMQGKRHEYFRHARIDQRIYCEPDLRSCDFPRHGGFYIFD